jgi:hypothetical protein
VSPSSPPATALTISRDDGRYGIRRRVEGARARLRESRGAGATVAPTRPVSQELQGTASGDSRRSGVFPPGFDLSEFSTYARSNDPVSVHLLSIQTTCQFPLAHAHRPSLVP